MATEEQQDSASGASAMAAATALDPALVTEAFCRLIPRDFAREHLLCSQGRDGDAECIVHAASSAPDAVFNVGVRLQRPIRTTLADEEQLAAVIDAAYERVAGGQAADTERLAAETGTYELRSDAEELERLLAISERDLLRTSGKAPIVKLADKLLFDALQRGASDLHIQPLADHIAVRRRVDGVLDEGERLPLNFLRPLISRIKVMGRMDVAERLVPQDGRCSVTIGERSIDIRISSLPTPHGERLVLRLLDSTLQLHDFAQLGMPPAVADPFLAAARRSSGIILVTGPTGSGKTTTLYATLRELDSRERNIMTIEDPIEYELDSLGLPISQSQVNTKKGVTFANGLRHVLRQDPDIIMVGEIRDTETARTAIQCSLTGHLVFSTLHTNDAVSAVTRLIDLGVEPYLVAASLSLVLAQRLVRTSCPDCDEASRSACTTCSGSGFKGRCGVFELLPISEALRAGINRAAALEELRQLAEADGMITLGQAGAELVAAGRTTAVEVERVIHG